MTQQKFGVLEAPTGVHGAWLKLWNTVAFIIDVNETGKWFSLLNFINTYQI